ncbi:hypothetical protein Dimus_039492 [Dionaea muscipula]
MLTDGIAGEPVDPSLLRSFEGHVAFAIWNGDEWAMLDCHSRAVMLRSWRIDDDADVMGYVIPSQPEISSFHHSFGEMTITLHDVAYILSVSVTGHAIFTGVDAERAYNLKTQMMLLLRLTIRQMEQGWKNNTVKYVTVQERLSTVRDDPERVASIFHGFSL